MMTGSGDCEGNERTFILGETDEAQLQNVDGRLTSVITNQELGKLLECPVCYEIILPPVFMCISGHNICVECRNQCLNCPCCRGPFLPEARNHLAESIVDKCTFICRYQALGCNFIFSGHHMVRHLHQECEFRPVTCRDCKRKIPFDSYLCHLSEFENIPKQKATECSTGFDIKEDDFSHDWTGQTWEPTWLHCFGTDFFCYLESSNLYWWIYVIGFGPESVLEGYMYDALVWNQSKRCESRFMGPVHSFRKTGNEIIQTGQCLKTTEQGIRAMMNQGGIDVVVRIFESSDYQPPKSRNTGQPIHSPLSLRTSAGGIDSVTTGGQAYQRLGVEPTNNQQQQPDSIFNDQQNNRPRTLIDTGINSDERSPNRTRFDSTLNNLMLSQLPRLPTRETNSLVFSQNSQINENSSNNPNLFFPQQGRRRVRTPCLTTQV